jgi:p-methyltransferase
VKTKGSLDAIVISSYGVSDAARLSSGKNADLFELHQDGNLCTFDFLAEYFRSGRNADLAKAAVRNHPPSRRFPTYLSGVYLADFLRRQLGFRARVINSFGEETARLEALLAQDPAYVLISTTLILLPEYVAEIIRFVRERKPKITIIVGGTKLHKCYKVRELFDLGGLQEFSEEVLAKTHYFFGGRKDEADYYIINPRGETTLLNLIRGLEAHQEVSHLDNLAFYRTDGTLQMNPIREEPEFLRDWMIDWQAVDDAELGYEIPVTIKQGCPFRCNFCDFVSLGKPLYSRDLDQVIRELRLIQDRCGNREISFVDENLFFTKQQLEVFCRRLIAENLGLRWRGLCRVNVIDRDSAGLLRQAGCYNMSLGIESGSDTILRNMNKQTTAAANLSAVTHLNEAGIGAYATFVVGFPGETEATLQSTIDMIQKFPASERALNFYHAFPFVLIPLCKAATPDFRQEFNLSGCQSFWKHPTMDFKEAARNVARIFLQVQNVYARYLDSSEIVTLRAEIPQHRTILQARQQIAQSRLRKQPASAEAPLWDTLAQAFAQIESRGPLDAAPSKPGV